MRVEAALVVHDGQEVFEHLVRGSHDPEAGAEDVCGERREGMVALTAHRVVRASCEHVLGRQETFVGLDVSGTI